MALYVQGVGNEVDEHVGPWGIALEEAVHRNLEDDVPYDLSEKWVADHRPDGRVGALSHGNTPILDVLRDLAFDDGQLQARSCARPQRELLDAVKVTETFVHILE